MAKVLITWSDRGPKPAEHHGVRAASDRGPVWRFLSEHPNAEDYGPIYLLTSPLARVPAEAVAEEMRADGLAVEVEVLPVADPSDYEQLFAALGPFLGRLDQRFPAADHQRDVLVSAGTPQCQTVWLLLVQSGILDARMFQVIPAAFVPNPHPRAVKLLNLDFEGFPEIRALREELFRLRQSYEPGGLGDLGSSELMRELSRRVARLAISDLPVLIIGETGVGKERVARALHAQGPRSARAFVAENCSAFADGLLANELFGSEKGAFTGAQRRHRGLFEQADGGTLFLDEIGEMEPKVQAMFLRVLQEGEVRRVGGESSVHVDLRIIAATHRPLRELVEAGQFREDLYYRLRGAELNVPALRARREEVPELVEYFIGRYAKAPLTVSREAMAQLCRYRWPGNIRELESEVRRWTVFHGRRVGVRELSPEIVAESAAPSKDEAAPGAEDIRLADALAATEAQVIAACLKRHQGNLSRTAGALAIDRNTLKRKLKKLGLYNFGGGGP